MSSAEAGKDESKQDCGNLEKLRIVLDFVAKSLYPMILIAVLFIAWPKVDPHIGRLVVLQTLRVAHIEITRGGIAGVTETIVTAIVS